MDVRWIIPFGILAIIAVSGCTQNTSNQPVNQSAEITTRYVCPNGSVATTAEACNTQAQSQANVQVYNESWACSDWSNCTEQNIQTRICINLGTEGSAQKPSESRACTYTSNSVLSAEFKILNITGGYYTYRDTEIAQIYVVIISVKNTGNVPIRPSYVSTVVDLKTNLGSNGIDHLVKVLEEDPYGEILPGREYINRLPFFIVIGAKRDYRVTISLYDRNFGSLLAADSMVVNYRTPQDASFLI